MEPEYPIPTLITTPTGETRSANDASIRLGDSDTDSAIATGPTTTPIPMVARTTTTARAAQNIPPRVEMLRAPGLLAILRRNELCLEVFPVPIPL